MARRASASDELRLSPITQHLSPITRLADAVRGQRRAQGEQ